MSKLCQGSCCGSKAQTILKEDLDAVINLDEMITNAQGLPDPPGISAALFSLDCGRPIASFDQDDKAQLEQIVPESSGKYYTLLRCSPAVTDAKPMIC